MHLVRLIHWNAAGAKERAAQLSALGYSVESEILAPPHLLLQIKVNPPDALVIDLSRLPSQGRDVGVILRQRASTRFVPLVFVEGEDAKVERIRKLLPDAIYTSWDKIARALKEAIRNPPVSPVTPKSALDGYSGAPLVKKLGIKPGYVVALVHAPSGFEKRLQTLTKDVTMKSRASKEADLTLWFNKSRAEFVQRVDSMTRIVGSGKLWIIWPKLSGRLASDLRESVVRQHGLATGFVDYKICSIDETWSGLLFTKRKAEKLK
jgi:hypothetical protein